jgi:hypothetical protein
MSILLLAHVYLDRELEKLRSAIGHVPGAPQLLRCCLIYGLFGFKPLQFFNFRDMPLQFVYSEICHYNSGST